MLVHNRKISIEKGVAAVAHKMKSFVPIGFQIVEKNAADSPSFASMRYKEVLVAPLLETLVIRNPRVSIASFFPCSVKMGHVLTIGIIRSQVASPTEPLFGAFGQEPKIGVYCRHHWVPRMKDQGNPRGGERCPFPRNLSGEFFGQTPFYI